MEYKRNRNKYIRALLNSKNITTLELSKLMNISQATLNKKIKGDIRFSERDIKILLDVLNMSYEEIFSNDYYIVSVNDKVFIVPESTAKKVIDTIISKNSKEVS